MHENVPNEQLSFEPPPDPQTYYWRVQGVGGGVVSKWSKKWRFTTVVAAPGEVVLLHPADGARGVSVYPVFRWIGPDSTLTYQLQVATDSAFSNLAVNDSALTTTADTLVTELGPDMVYFWRVRGRNASGDGPWSSVYSFLTAAAYGKPELLTPPNGAVSANLEPLLSWTVSGPDHGIHVFKDDSSTVIFRDGLPTATYQIKAGELEPEQTYHWQVYAHGIRGAGPWSEVWTFHTGVATPSAVTLVSPEDGATGVPPHATLSWQPMDDVVGYHLQLASDSSFRAIVADDSLLAEASITLSDPLAYSTTYYWHVRAGRDDGLGKSAGVIYGPWSPTRSFTVAVGTATEDQTDLPTAYALHANYPNPFNPATTIQIDVPETAHVTLAVYNVLGHEVLRLESGSVPPGRHRYVVEASSLPSGVYLYQIETAAFSQSRRMILLK
jgi:hypothetical protein